MKKKEKKTETEDVFLGFVGVVVVKRDGRGDGGTSREKRKRER